MLDAAPDAGFVCADDSAYEPNETIQTAYVTDVDTTSLTRVFTGLSVCNDADEDMFAIMITTANRNLEIFVDYEASYSWVQASILNSGGIPIANASGGTTTPKRLRAYTPNLPTGIYYVTAYAVEGYRDNYALTITVTGP